MKTRSLILFVATLLLSIPQNSLPQAIARTSTSSHTYDQVFFVRPPGTQYGTGDGSDWNNAFSDIPENLVRGAKYYLASGVYSSGASEPYHIFNDAELGEQYTGIFKATTGDPGTEIGWEPSFGQGPAQLGPLHFITGYYEVDGQTGSHNQGHGFKLYVASCTEQQKDVYFPWNSTSSHVELKHIDMGLCGPTTFTASQTSIYSVHSVNNIIISDCYIHDANRTFIMMVGWSDVLVENNYFARSGRQQESHSLGVRSASNVTIRNNIFEDAINSYINMWEPNNVHIYSNVFTRTANDDWSVYALVDNYDTATNVLIYNNTIYNLKGLNVGVRITGILNNVQVYNNLWANSRANQIQLSGIHDYNAFYDNWRVGEDGNPLYSLDQRMLEGNVEENIQVITDSPFVAPNEGDFHLAFATEPGATLPAPFDRDPDSAARGTDGTWDRGAFEFTPSQLILHGAPANQAVRLTWTVNATLPTTTTWQIDYFTTPANTLTATEPISTTRSHTLRELTNGEWHTITLNAMVGTSAILSDTVRVMPTNIFTHLPLILKENER